MLRIQDVLTAEPHILRELSVRETLNELWNARRFLTLGAVYWRVAEYPPRFGFRNVSAFANKIGLTHEKRASLSIFRLSLPYGLDYDELEEVEGRGLNSTILRNLLTHAQTKETLFHYLKMPIKDLEDTFKRKAYGSSRLTRISFHGNTAVAAFITGMKINLQRHYGLTPDQAFILPFVFYKAMTETKPARRFEFLVETLESFGLNSEIAVHLLPRDAWKATHKLTATQADFDQLSVKEK